MSESDYKLTIATTSKEAGLPSEEVVLAAGRALIDSVTSWKRGKAFSHGTVQTYSKAKGSGDGASWHCRISEHGPEDATFDELWKYLGVEHAEHESQYIKDVKRATLIKELAPNRSIWSMYYEFPTFGVSSRVFTALQISTIEGNAGKRIGFFIQIPVDLSDQPDLAAKEGKGVKGRYVSVERFKELENGKVEWRMATSSSPGGSIPSFLVEGTMDSQIAADVPHFLKWLHKLRNEGATDTGENGAIRGQSSTATADIAPEIVTNPEVDAMKTTIAAPTGTMPPMAA